VGVELNNKEEKMRGAFNKQPRIKKMLEVGFLELIIASFVFSGGLLGQVQAAIPTIEREALIALYNSTDGDNWDDNSGWKTPPLHTDGFATPGTENTWYGITCNSGNTTVESLSLYNNELTGSIPPELGALANLQYLRLSSPQLTGSIPIELMNMENLSFLDICNNHLYTTNPGLRDFLTNLQPGWESCQTPPFFRAIPWIPFLLLDD
jgi:hypothetical protein